LYEEFLIAEPKEKYFKKSQISNPSVLSGH